MKRYGNAAMVLIAAMLVSCGGGGGGGGDSSSGSAGTPGGMPGSPGGSGTGQGPAVAGAHVEETNPAVAFSGAWTQSDPQLGWSGGSAIQSTTAGSTVTISFTGTSIRWLGSRGRAMGIATVISANGPS